MLPSPSLVNDHLLLRSVLDAFEVFQHQVEAHRALNREDLERFTDFFRLFGDEYHAAKEETVLLPSLARSGVEWQHGALAQSRREHRQQRYLVRVLSQLAKQEDAYGPEALRRVASQARAFSTHMRAHLNMEDDRLFPLMDGLSPEQREQLENALDAFDDSPLSADALSHARESVAALVARYATRGPLCNIDCSAS